MSTTLIIVLLLLGVLLIALEIVALPGGIAGLFGALMLGVGVWQSYAAFGPRTGNIILVCSVALIALFIALLLKRKTWQRFSLDDEVKSRTNTEADAVKAGARGTTISRLAPTGKALIDGRQLEVHAVNKFIDPDRPIEVVAVEGYRIDVRELTDTRFEEA